MARAPSPKERYRFAAVATDIALFTVRERGLQVLLIEMQKKPFTGRWALPGALIRPTESVDAAAVRILREKAGVKDVYLEQLGAFGRVNRDPFGRVVSVAYFALVPSDQLRPRTTAEHRRIDWFPATKTLGLAYDHDEILRAAVARLREKLATTNVAYSLLPFEFTLTDLQRTYEIILSKKLDKRNFRRKILSLGLVRPTGKKRRGFANRPALLYRFTARTPQSAKIL